MDNSITRELVYRSENVFEEIKINLSERKKLEFTVNLFLGLIEKNLIYYYLSDLPNYYKLNEKKEDFHTKALMFLEHNIDIFFELLIDTKEPTIQENLFYIVAKYLPKTQLSFEKYLQFIFITLSLLKQTKKSLYKQAVCRYDIETLAKTYCNIDINCKNRFPFEEIKNKLQEPDDDYKKIYLSLSDKAKILYLSKNEELPQIDDNKLQELFNKLPLSIEEELKLAIEERISHSQ